MKECFKCKIQKNIDEFYKHPQMTDGHLGKCKECAKKDANDRYYNPKFHPSIIAYEARRFKDPRRKKNILKSQRKMRKNNAEKYKSRQATHRAVKNGTLIKTRCEICGDIKSQAHHTDYSKPLEVMWLCRKHHMIEEGKQPF